MNRKRLDNHSVALHNVFSSTFQRLFATTTDDTYQVTPSDLVKFVTDGRMTVKQAQIILEERFGCKFD